MAQRKIRLQERDENSGGTDPTLPFLLLVVDLLEATFAENSPLQDLVADAAISILLEEGAQLGAAVVFLVPERAKVPGGCVSVIEIERTTPATNSRIVESQKIHFRYAEVGVNSFRYIGAADYVTRRRRCFFWRAVGPVAPAGRALGQSHPRRAVSRFDGLSLGEGVGG